MDLRRPTDPPAWSTRLAGRLDPRRLRRRLPTALAVAALVALAPGAVRRAGPGDDPGSVVLVAATDLAAGHVVADGDLRARTMPPDVTPPGAVASVAAGTVVRSAIGEGEIVVGHRLGGDGVPGRLAPDERAVALPWPPARPPVAVGDTVDLVGTSADGAPGPAGARLLVAGAVVLAVADDGVTVAVPADAAATVHQALATGAVELAVTPFRP